MQRCMLLQTFALQLWVFRANVQMYASYNMVMQDSNLPSGHAHPPLGTALGAHKGQDSGADRS